MAKIVVAITGASGVVYGTELVNWLLINGHQVYLVLSDPARLVLKQELDWETKDCQEAARYFAPGSITCFDNSDIGAPIASGSFVHDEWRLFVQHVHLAEAQGTPHLIERAAYVCSKKEGNGVVPRETPLTCSSANSAVWKPAP